MLFEENGGRIDRDAINKNQLVSWLKDGKLGGDRHFSDRMGSSTLEKRDYYMMQNGVFKSGPDGSHTGKQMVAMIKPYIVSRHADSSDPTRVQHFPLDKCRIFGKAISNANPFEMVDIMLSRQAI